MLMLDLTVVNVALPDIRTDFSATFTQLQWVLDAYALGLVAVLVAAGSLADRIGRRRLFLIGLVIFTAASLFCGIAWNIGILIAAFSLRHGSSRAWAERISSPSVPR